ncbi:MAG: hypothetical protein WCB96_07730 [Candidatus Aminicenantales bacterium]
MLEGKLKGVVFILVLLLALPAAIAARQDFPERAPGDIAAKLSVDPASYTGDCPVTVTFQGTIAAKKACTVQYRFRRSNGATTPVKVLNFLGAGFKTVGDTWKLDKKYSGWEAIEVTAPVQIQSNQASFTVTCAAKPHITSVMDKYFGYPDPEFDVVGSNFGDTQGIRKVRVDGVLVSSYPFWHDTAVGIELPVAFTPWEHVYEFCFVAGASNIISNVYSHRFLYRSEAIIPHEGPVGTEVKFPVFRLPASPGGLVLKIDTYTMPITSWKGGGFGEIKAKIPAGVPLGEHDVYLRKGSDVVSNKLKFNVT